STRALSVWYGPAPALKDITFDIPRNQITALIGPSGCGKSTLLRCFNRMNDFVPGFRLEGSVHFQGTDLYAPGVDPAAVRHSIGMVFQQPSAFAMSIYENVAFGLKLLRLRGDYREQVERA